MFLANWFELSGVDEILAPTNEDSPAPKNRSEEESPIWSILAPRAESSDMSTIKTPAPKAVTATNGAGCKSGTNQNGDHVICQHCHQLTPIDGPRSSPTTISEDRALQLQDKDLNERVLKACSGAAATARDTNNYEKINRMFQFALYPYSGEYDPSDPPPPSKNLKKFKKHLEKHPDVITARAGMINGAFNGDTVLHSACHGEGNPEVVDFLLQQYILNDEDDRLDVDDRDCLGCTALHVAAYNGNATIIKLLKKAYETLEERENGAEGEGGLEEMTEQLKGMSTDEATTFKSPPPKSKIAVKSRSPKRSPKRSPARFAGKDAAIDLSGKTSLGLAVTSPRPSARRNRNELKKMLYKTGDRCVEGLKTPPNTRCGGNKAVFSPVRTGKTPPPINYLSPTPKKGNMAPLTSNSEYGTPFSSLPSTISEAAVDNGKGVHWGASEKPGWRGDMEDAICSHCPIGVPARPSNIESNAAILGIFGVFDGHGDGGIASEFIAQNLLIKLEQHPQWPVAYHSIDSDDNSTTEGDGAMMNVLKETFHELDIDLKNGASQGKHGGTTAIVALVSEAKMIVANVGDSRCILVKKKTDRSEGANELDLDNLEIIAMSEDHKPNLPTERPRIEAAGMTIHVDQIPPTEGQVGPTSIHKVKKSEKELLATSRAFGDFDFKSNENLTPSRQAVICTPEIVVRERKSDEDMYLILACDGIWDVMSNEEVGEFVVKHVSKRVANEEEDILAKVGDDLLDLCLDKGSQDNMSVQILSFPASGCDHSEVANDRKKLF